MLKYNYPILNIITTTKEACPFLPSCFVCTLIIYHITHIHSEFVHSSWTHLRDDDRRGKPCLRHEVMPLKTAALGSLISQRGREHSRTNKLTKPDKKQTTTTTTTMDFCFGTFAALFLIIAAASCAPTGHNLHDACEDVKTSSLALNHVARIVSMEVRWCKIQNKVVAHNNIYCLMFFFAVL